MKKLITLLFVAAGVAAIFGAALHSENGIAGYTNSPGETNCRNCHSGHPLNDPTGSITITSDMNNFGYIPGRTYTINVKIIKSGQQIFGIGCEILKADSSNAGTIVVTNTAKTQLKNKTINGKVRTNLCHKTTGGLANDSTTFSFSWTAPAVGAGNVKLYVACNAANNNGSESGDYIYTAVQTLTYLKPLLTCTPSSLTGFTATTTLPSKSKSFVLNGTNLTDSIKIVAPSEWQVSLTGTSGWVKTLKLQQVNNLIAPTTIFVRYKPVSAGNDTANITCSSVSAISKKVNCIGTSTVREMDPALADDVIIGPNPVSDQLKIAHLNASGETVISIYDVAGKLIKENVVTADSYDVNTIDLKNGIYICRIKNGDRFIEKKFLKN